MCTNCYFPASNQNFAITIRFSDPNFLKETNNLATGWHLHALTLNILVHLSNSIPNWSKIKQSTAELQQFKDLKFEAVHFTVGEFQSLCIHHRPITHPHSKFEQNQTIHGIISRLKACIAINILYLVSSTALSLHSLYREHKQARIAHISAWKIVPKRKLSWS